MATKTGSSASSRHRTFSAFRLAGSPSTDQNDLGQDGYGNLLRCLGSDIETYWGVNASQTLGGYSGAA